MVAGQDFRVSMVQAAIFTQNTGSFSTTRAVAIALGKYAERFSGELQAFKLPCEMPVEVPHVFLQSSDSKWRMQLSPTRIDVVWADSASLSSESSDKVADNCAEMLEFYVRESNVKVNRLALIIQRVCPCDSPAHALIDRFCNEASKQEPFNRSANFEIHNHKVFEPDQKEINFRVNSWVRCKTAEKEPGNTPIILIEQDINTVAEEAASRQFSAEEVKRFFPAIYSEANVIFAKYFPN